MLPLKLLVRGDVGAVTFGDSSACSRWGRNVAFETTRDRVPAVCGAWSPCGSRRRGFCPCSACQGEGSGGEALGNSWSSLTGEGATAGLRNACEQGCGPELGSRAETGGASQAGSESAGIRAGPEEGLGQPRDAPDSGPAASPALLVLRSLRETQTFSQTERARRSQGPEHEWGAR